MQKERKRFGAVALVACLLAVLAFGGVMAWAQDSGQGGANSLTVKADLQGEGEAEGSTATVTFDVYKIADATKDGSFDTYNYTFIAPFDKFNSDKGYYDPQNMTGAKWQELADASVELIGNTAPIVKGHPVDEAVTGLQNGLFLVVAANAKSQTYEYKFNPTVVALPTKEPLKDDAGNIVVDEDGYPIINTAADFGDWVNAAEISLKYTYEPLYGSLKVVKKVDNFRGEPATFVFHIVGKTPTGQEYDNVLQVYYDGGTSCEATDTHIPAGTVVTVTEVSESNRFVKVSADNAEKTIVADEFVENGDTTVATVEFENHQTEDIPQGHGVQNNFEYSQASGDWEWTAVPDTAKTEAR